MNRTSFAVLAVVTVLSVAVALLIGQGRSSAPVLPESAELVPGLREVVNEIDRVVVRSGDARATLERQQDRWVVVEKDAYTADGGLVIGRLRELATGHRSEPRTAKPEWHARLGVSDPDSADAGGVGVDFPSTELPSLIIGQLDPSGQASFVRLVGDDQAWLADRALDLTADPLSWLKREIMDIPAAEIAELTLRHPDGETVILRPADERGQDWVLIDVPEGREVEPMWRIRPLADALANLRLDDVRAHSGQLPQGIGRALYVTRDGLNFVVSLLGEGWVHFSVSAELPAGEPGQELSEEETASSVDAAVAAESLSPWEFRLPEAKIETFSRSLEDLLVDLPESEDS